jgi:hypothetical protein
MNGSSRAIMVVAAVIVVAAVEFTTMNRPAEDPALIPLHNWFKEPTTHWGYA